MRVNIFSKAQKEKQEKAIDRCCSIYYVMVGAIYNIAQSAMVDAYTAVRKDPRFRHETKQNMKLALACYDKWDKRMKDVLQDRYQLWLDLTDSIAEHIDKDTKILLYAFDDHLQKYDVPEHTKIATVELSLTIVKMARIVFENLFDSFRDQCGVDLRPMFVGGDFRDVSFRWERATKVFLHTDDGKPNINFNDSQRVRLAYDVLMTRLSNADTYNMAGKEALKMNEDVCRKYDPNFDESMKEIELANA